MYEAMRAQRRELDRQLDQLENRRENLAEQLNTRAATPDADRTGLEARLVEVDKRIADVEKQIAASDAQVAAAAAVPGAVIEQPGPRFEPRFVNNGPPEEVVITGVVFSALVLFPISLALAKRIWRRGAVNLSTMPQELWQRLSRLEEAVDSVAMEVERIGEGQRFTNKLFSERGIGAGAAQPLDVKAGDPVHARNSTER